MTVNWHNEKTTLDVSWNRLTKGQTYDKNTNNVIWSEVLNPLVEKIRIELWGIFNTKNLSCFSGGTNNNDFNNKEILS